MGFGGGVDKIVARIDEAALKGDIDIVEALATTWEGALWVARIPKDGFPVFDFIEYFRTSFSDVHGGTRPRRSGPIDIVTPGGKYLGTLGEARMPEAFGPDGLVAYLENGRPGRAHRRRETIAARVAGVEEPPYPLLLLPHQLQLYDLHEGRAVRALLVPVSEEPMLEHPHGEGGIRPGQGQRQRVGTPKRAAPRSARR